jgi:ubiquinone/menaquinone biosynthesis C-methylase UbiE
MECDEGCGCEIPEGKGVVLSINGTRHAFCCFDCADVFRESLSAEVADAVRQHVVAGQTVVEVGCGAGYYTQLLRDLVGDRGTVYAVDPDPARLQQAERHLGCRFGPANSGWVHFLRSTRPLRAGSADLVLSNNVLCCTRDRSSAVREMRRVIRPGGVAYVRVNDVRVKGVAPIDDAEWKKLFSDWTRLGEGTVGPVRWKLLARPA